MVTAAPAFTNLDLTVTTVPFISAKLTAGTAVVAGTLFEFFESCNIFLIGQKDPAKAPAKDISDWWTKNISTLASKELITTSFVSSWAIVVDIKWKTAFVSPVRYKGATDD